MKNDRRVLAGFLILVVAASLFLVQRDGSSPPGEAGLHSQNESTLSTGVNETGDNGPLVPITADGVDFEEESTGFVECPPAVQVKSQYYQSGLEHLVNFTLFLNGTPKANVTLEGVEGKYFCIPEGIVVYSYYPGEWRSFMAIFDYNPTPLWVEKYSGLPKMYRNGSIILRDEGCLYFVSVKTGKLRGRVCVYEYLSHFKFVGERLYITAAHLKGRAHLYVFEDNTMREVSIINISTFELVGIRMPLDVNEKYIAVAYFLYPTDGAEKNGICIFKKDTLEKIACKEFEEWDRPLKVKLEGDTVYVQTTKGVKAYKITAPW